MSSNKKEIARLKAIIDSQLEPFTNKKAILLDAPYYRNVGDVLIWEGTIEFFKRHGIENLYTSSLKSCVYPSISQDTIVFISGGGNLGDLYREHTEFLFRVANTYKRNTIVVLPQTLYYRDKELAAQELSRLSANTNIYFCARDKYVFSVVSEYFKERTLLVPDMAFYIDISDLDKYRKAEVYDNLCIKRTDFEKGDSQYGSEKGTYVSDWPSNERKIKANTFINAIFDNLARHNIALFDKYWKHLWDLHSYHLFRKGMIKEGVQFISPYRNVRSSRLHGCILSILLDKNVEIVNNSYGKNANFYHAWLESFKNVKLLGE